jgi:DNA-binding transcriptional LysR family regulator
MPTLRQLEYLVTVAELGSFTRAAAELHVSQPTLSSQIAVLEREVGGSLLDRLPRTVCLTPAGRALIPHARAALTEARRTLTAARQTVGLEGGELKVAAVHSATLGLLPAPLRRWRQTHPGVQLGLHEYRHGDELTAAMRNGEADVAIGPTPDDWSGDLLSLGDEELLIVLASDDPLAGWQGSLELTFLADRAWVHFAPEHGLAELLDKACAEAGFSPKVGLRAEQTASAPLLAAAGLGPTLVPASIISIGFDGLIFETSPPTRRPLAVYHRLNADPLTVEFSHSIAAEVELMPPHIAMRLRLTERTRPPPTSLSM